MTSEIFDATMNGMTHFGLNATRIEMSQETADRLKLEAQGEDGDEIGTAQPTMLFGVPVTVQDVLAARFRVVFDPNDKLIAEHIDPCHPITTSTLPATSVR